MHESSYNFAMAEAWAHLLPPAGKGLVGLGGASSDALLERNDEKTPLRQLVLGKQKPNPGPLNGIGVVAAWRRLGDYPASFVGNPIKGQIDDLGGGCFSVEIGRYGCLPLG